MPSTNQVENPPRPSRNRRASHDHRKPPGPPQGRTAPHPRGQPRLLAGTPQRSNGTLTVAALAAEAALSRYRLYEHHPDLVTEFKTTTLAGGPATPGADALRQQLADARGIRAGAILGTACYRRGLMREVTLGPAGPISGMAVPGSAGPISGGAVPGTAGPISGSGPACVVAGRAWPGAVPRTVFGLITEALRRRWRRGLAPFTVMSCDNLQGNGDLSRKVFIASARLRDPELGDWVEREVRFPNSMVDRITPVTTDADRAEVAERFGIEDRWPVLCEPYTQWVLQDAFTTGRPPYAEAGVQLVEDVEPYDLMKLRLLNGSHQAMCYFAYLAGYRLVHEAARDPLFRAFLLGYMNSEATPTLDPVPGVDLTEYKHTLIERFSNPQIRDTIARLCAESSDRIPKFVLPVIRAQLAAGGEIRWSAAVVASWARYAEGIDEQGQPIEVVDRYADTLTRLARRQREDPGAFIADRDVFGDLADNERFAAAYRSALASLHQRGARATLEALSG